MGPSVFLIEISLTWAYKMTFESVFNFEVYCLLTEYKNRAMKY